MHHATTPIGIQLSDSILRPKHSPSTRKVDNIFVLNVRAHHKSEFSRRKSLGGCSTMASLTEALIAVKALFEKAMSVRGQNGGQASFRNARNETINLKNVNLESVFLVLQQAITPNARAEARRETKLCFDALRSVMRMHACECIDIVEYSSSCYLCTLCLCTDSREKQMLLRLICVASQNFIFQALFSCFIINYVDPMHGIIPPLVTIHHVVIDHACCDESACMHVCTRCVVIAVLWLLSWQVWSSSAMKRAPPRRWAE